MPTRDVLLFAGLRDTAQAETIRVQLPEEATVRDLLESVGDQFPPLSRQVRQCRVAVDHAFAHADDRVDLAVEIALIPPVSGGHDGASVQVTHEPLQLAAVVRRVEHRLAGGIATFTGNVRAHSRGQDVQHLEYEAYVPMATTVLERIVADIEARVARSRVAIHHRLGRLEIGEAAVVIAASAPHRAEAFEACRAAIEALKRDAPIWKKEFDVAGSVWIGSGP